MQFVKIPTPQVPFRRKAVTQRETSEESNWRYFVETSDSSKSKVAVVHATAASEPGCKAMPKQDKQA